ncbi:MAG: hypothetical protein EBU49_01695 [Proteobacteria bacterium]|nr:hypothetical protein [Pseudomonadota bacterium]
MEEVLIFLRLSAAIAAKKHSMMQWQKHKASGHDTGEKTQLDFSAPQISMRCHKRQSFETTTLQQQPKQMRQGAPGVAGHCGKTSQMSEQKPPREPTSWPKPSGISKRQKALSRLHGPCADAPLFETGQNQKPKQKT